MAMSVLMSGAEAPEPKPLRWQFLSDAERRTLEEYNQAVVRLISQRSMKYDQALERRIRMLRLGIDMFIDKLNQKYNG